MSDVKTQNTGDELANSSRPGGVPIYFEKHATLVHDPASAERPAGWIGANNITFKLLRCVEAVRDITSILKRLVKLPDPAAAKRDVKQLAVPLYTLSQGVDAMFKELEGAARDYRTLTEADKEQMRRRASKFAADLPLGKSSPLRMVRDKIGAHLDLDAVQAPAKFWEGIDLFQFLKWLGLCLGELLHVLPLEVFAWWRDNDNPDINSLMSVDGTLLHFYGHDDNEMIIGVTFTPSPKQAIRDEICDVIGLNNEIMCQYADRS